MAEATPHLDAGSAEVAHNLAEADHMQGLTAHEGAGNGESHSELAFMGIGPGAFVSAAMAVFIIILLVKNVPALIGKGLDGRIAAIKAQLEEASKLRAEAEALKAEYEKKLKAVAGEADALRARAEEDAAALIEDAKTNAAALVKRRQKMAEEKIGAAERAALADVRAKAVSAATAAATALIAQNHDAAADKALVDGTIKAL